MAPKIESNGAAQWEVDHSRGMLRYIDGREGAQVGGTRVGEVPSSYLIHH